MEASEFATLLADDVSFQGDFDVQDSMIIEGSCKDSTLKAALLVVSGVGSVQGKVTAKCLVISGLVDGKVSVSKNLHVLEGGEIKGSLLTTALIVDEGASLNASCYMLKLEAKTKEMTEKKIDDTTRLKKKD